MSNELRFYQCHECGSVYGLIHDGGGEMTCCGKKVPFLKANTVDASLEKHVPVVERKDGLLHVTVGVVKHPMTEAHYIEWIAVLSEDMTQRFVLRPGKEPAAAAFSAQKGTVYAYCNLHGLWKADF